MIPLLVPGVIQAYKAEGFEKSRFGKGVLKYAMLSVLFSLYFKLFLFAECYPKISQVYL